MENSQQFPIDQGQPEVSIARSEERQALPSWNGVTITKDHEQQHLARFGPIDRTLAFQVERLLAQRDRAVLAYGGRIDSGSFYLQITRRDHPAAIHSRLLEQELDRTLMDYL